MRPRGRGLAGPRPARRLPDCLALPPSVTLGGSDARPRARLGFLGPSGLERSHMFAIVEAGGRQEKVAPGALVMVDRLDVEPGAAYTFDKVLLVSTDGGDYVTGKPYVAGASVTAVVQAQTQGKKIRVFKM